MEELYIKGDFYIYPKFLITLILKLKYMQFRITLLLCFMLMMSGLQAQLASGTIAPDFTVTDIDGVEHHLYDYLDEGKTVILDIFATWCGPCWSYHQGHTLEDIYQELGPNGTNELMVLTIEADGNTAVDCITGADNCNTFGDWTEGVSYPLIDAPEIRSLYSIAYYPTIYMVYPNRVLNEVAQRSYDEMKIWVNAAEKLDGPQNPSVTSFTGINGSICTPSWVFGPSYTISNMGEETLTSFDYEIRNGNEVITSDSWSGSAAPYQIATQIQVTPSIVSENVSYDFYFTNINGEATEKYETTTSLTFEVENTIYVNALTDENASSHENRYEIRDEFGFVVGDGFLGNPNEQYNNRHDLPAEGCYEFELFDFNNDGISGEIEVVDVAGNVIYGNTGFNPEMTSSFQVSAVTSVDDVIDTNTWTVSPNPASTQVTLSIPQNDSEVLSLTVIGIDGRAYPIQMELNNESATLNVTELPEGIYTLVVLTTEGRGIKQFVKG